MTTTPVELAPEPVYDDVTWVSSYDVNPFDVPTADKTAVLADWTVRLCRGSAVDHATATLLAVQENKYYADLAGTRTTQQRVRLEPGFEAMGGTSDVFDSMTSIVQPVGAGWEYVVGDPAAGAWDWDAELDEVPDLLAEKLKAPTVEAGRHDLVIHPSNLWLTIHESIGHATELDRALGYEANYAGTSFATPDQVGTLRYGSPVMQVTGDRTIEHGLATIGYDDEGVATQQWDIVRDGILVGFQLDRPMAALMPELNRGRSNGCAYADSPGHIPIQRMANVSLQPAPDGPTTEELDRPGRARPLRRRREVLVDRHAALQLPVHRPAVLPDRRRRAGRPGARRRLPGDDHRLLGLDGGGRRSRDLAARRGVQLRQGATGPGRRGEPRLPDRAVPRRADPQHHRGGRPMTPQELVEHALAASTADDCVVIVRDTTSANLRWANNTLTTNGQMSSRRATVVSFVGAGDQVAVGSTSGVATTADEITDIVLCCRHCCPGGRARRGRQPAHA